MYAYSSPSFGETVYVGSATYSAGMTPSGSPYRPVSYDLNGGPRMDDRRNGRMEEEATAPASILVRLPADAKLTIDDNPTQSTSAERRFVSPPLQPGREFRYVLKASIVRQGETLTATQNVMVRAGKESEVTMEFPGAKARGD
jgi:uncharacterized protein (TIGR03000 family)